MAGASLLTLLDDIAAVLDDVAILTKVAAKKTAGVLGDDLAVNAEQVAGVRAEREIPVVLAVAKGSLLNKLILVPAALAISVFLPWLITSLLMLGGAFLCFEGAEKVMQLFSRKTALSEEDKVEQLLGEQGADLQALEQAKVKGAVRTDFILSAEIIAIALGTVQDASFAMQAAVISVLALFITLFVYGLVAIIVKLDDAGFYLLKDKSTGALAAVKRGVGRGLLAFAPRLMRTLTVVGTLAMFLVGGSIIVHGIPALAEWVHFVQRLGADISIYVALFAPSVMSGLIGLLLGMIMAVVVHFFSEVKVRTVE